MSEIRVNNITNREGSAGPSVAGIPVVDSNSHFVVPSGKTVGRYIEENTIVTDGLIFYVDAGRQESWDQGNQLGLTTSYWRDLSGNDYNVPVVDLPTYSADNGGSLLFDESAANVLRIPSDPGPLNPPTQVTVEVWAKYIGPQTSGSNSFICGRGDTGYNGYWIGRSGGSTTNPVINFHIGKSNPDRVSRAIWTSTGNVIRHWVGTFDGEDVKGYENGVLVDTTGSDYVPNQGSNKMQGGEIDYATSENFVIGNIGSSSDVNRYWDGNIYQIRIYNKALTAQEVLQNYNATKGRFGL